MAMEYTKVTYTRRPDDGITDNYRVESPWRGEWRPLSLYYMYSSYILSIYSLLLLLHTLFFSPLVTHHIISRLFDLMAQNKERKRRREKKDHRRKKRKNSRKNREEERREKWKKHITHQRGRGRLHHKKQERKEKTQKKAGAKKRKKKSVMLVVSSTLSNNCLLYTSPSPRDATLYRMPSSA